MDDTQVRYSNELSASFHTETECLCIRTWNIDILIYGIEVKRSPGYHFRADGVSDVDDLFRVSKHQ